MNACRSPVRFVDYDGTELSSQSVFWGEAAAAPGAPAREGYTFTGWDANFSNIRKDLTVTAQYRFVLSFADVSETDWFCEDVRWAVENGIFQGVGNGLFAPEQALTRGQLVTVLYRMAGSPEPKAEANFRDVAADSYYAKAVAWANETASCSAWATGRLIRIPPSRASRWSRSSSAMPSSAA